MKKILALALITSSCWAMDKEEFTPRTKRRIEKEERIIERLKIEKRKLELAEKNSALTKRSIEATELQLLIQISGMLKEPYDSKSRKEFGHAIGERAQRLLNSKE